MDIFFRLLLYMSRWSRQRPSRKLVITVCVVAVLIAVVVLIERFIGWPDALTVERMPRFPAVR